MDEWIKVTDRLPLPRQEIAAMARDGRILVGKWERIDCEETIDFFLTDDDLDEGYDWIKDVTHWMPRSEFNELDSPFYPHDTGRIEFGPTGAVICLDDHYAAARQLNMLWKGRQGE